MCADGTNVPTCVRYCVFIFSEGKLHLQNLTICIRPKKIAATCKKPRMCDC